MHRLMKSLKFEDIYGIGLSSIHTFRSHLAETTGPIFTKFHLSSAEVGNYLKKKKQCNILLNILGRNS